MSPFDSGMQFSANVIALFNDFSSIVKKETYETLECNCRVKIVPSMVIRERKA